MTHSTDILIRAKHMYFSDISVVDIAEELDIPINDLGIQIFGPDKTGHDPNCWYQERKQMQPGSFVTYQKVKSYILSSAEACLAKKVAESAHKLAEKKEILELDDMGKAVDIISKLDKIGRLERGESTDIISVEQGFSLREIENASKIVDAEFEDITNKPSTKEISDGRTNEPRTPARTADDIRRRNPIRFPRSIGNDEQ